MKNLILLKILLLSPLFILAYTKVDKYVRICDHTPHFDIDSTKPSKIYSTNNLTSKTGAFESAKGEKIVLVGRLFDKKCLPISGAVVSIWHNDLNGLNYNNSRFDKNFSGSGQATTDNLGRFNFTTVMPTPDKELPRRIFFQVNYSNKTILTTKLFFESKDNIKDKDFRDLNEIKRKNLIMTKYSFDKNKFYFLDLMTNLEQKFKSY